MIVNENTWDVALGSERTLLIDNNNYENPPAGLAAEGVHAYKIGEYYYFFMIQGASNPVRQQICWRSKTLEHGTFEVKKVFTGGIVDEEGKTVNSSWGVAQGGIVQTPEGEWYSIMFQDYHSVGRIPVLVPVRWGEDGWPVFGNDGKEIETVELTQDRIYLKVNCDFRENRKLNQTWRMKDEAYFYYSLDGENWTQIGDTLKMSYDWPDFMGYRFGLFYYSTRNCGGYVDFDSFHVGSVDGKRAELQRLIETAESIQRQPAHTEQQWEEFVQALAGAREVVKDLPEEESEMDLREIEKNNGTAYVAIQQLERAVEMVRKAVPSETETPSPLKTPFPSPSVQTPAPGVSVSLPPQDGTAVRSNRIVIRAAGYPLIKKGMYLTKGAKVSLRAEVLPEEHVEGEKGREGRAADKETDSKNDESRHL